MRNILIVGPLEYDILAKMSKEYPDVIFFRETAIIRTGAAALIALVDIFDGVMFTEHCDNSERTAFEVACIMNHVDVLEKDAFPLECETEGEIHESVCD